MMSVNVDVLFGCTKADQIQRSLRGIDVLFVDTHLHAEFFDKVVNPILQENVDAGLYKYTKASTSHHALGASAVETRRFEYCGPKTAVALDTDADDDEISHMCGGLVVLFTWQMGDTVERARVLELDRGSMLALAEHCIDKCFRLGIKYPHSLERRMVAMEIAAPFLYASFSKVLQKEFEEFQFLMFINRSLLANYARLLASNQRVKYIRKAPSQLIASSSSASSSSVAAIPESEEPEEWRLEREVSNDYYDEIERLERVDEQVATNSTADTPTQTEEVVEIEYEAPVSMMRCSPYLCFDRHELSDRLFDSTVDDAFAVRSAPSKLIKRCQLVMCAAHTLLVKRCQSRIDWWRAADLFYLYELCVFANQVQQVKPVMDVIRVIRSNGLAFWAVEHTGSALLPAATPQEIYDLVKAVLESSPFGIKGFTAQLFSDLQFNSLLDSFQTRWSGDRQREQATLVDVTHVTMATVIQFAKANALTTTFANLQQLVSPEHGEPLSVFLRFSAHDTTPLQLVSSVRIWVPTAADGADFLVVWAPSSYEIPRRVANPTSSIDVYLCMKRSVWRILALGAVPRVAVAAQCVAKPSRQRSLSSHTINAALASGDPLIMSYALNTVQLLTASPATYNRRIQPTYTWQPSDCRGADECVATFTSLASLFASNVELPTPADAPTRVNIALRVAKSLVEMQRKRLITTGDRVSSMDCLHAAVQVVVASRFVSLGIRREAAQQLANSTSITEQTRSFLQSQLALMQPVAQALAANTTFLNTQTDLRLLSPENALSMRCWCGTTPQNCDRMRRLLTEESTEKDASYKSLCIECCICYGTRVVDPLVVRKKRRRMSSVMCVTCRGRHVINAFSEQSDVLLLHDARVVATGTHAFVRELINGRCNGALCALRPIRGPMIAHVSPPRNLHATNSTREVQTERNTTRYTLEELAPIEPMAAELLSADQVARYELLLALERCMLLNHASFLDLDDSTEAGRRSIVDALIPFSEIDVRRACNLQLVEERALQTGQFPLCAGTMVETMADGAYSFESNASNELLNLQTRATRQLYCGRFPVPLSDSVPLLLPLMLVNFYTKGDI